MHILFMGLNTFLDWQQVLSHSKFCLSKGLLCIQGGRILHLSTAHAQHLPQIQGTRSVVCFCLKEIRLLSRFRSLELKTRWKTPNIMTLVSAWDLFKKGNRQMLRWE